MQSNPWNFTLAGSCVLGFALSQATHWLEGAGCIAEALPFLPSLPRSRDGHRVPQTGTGVRQGAVLCPVPECGAVSSQLRGVGPSLGFVCQTQGMAVLQLGWRWLCLRGQLLLTSLGLALALRNYVFNPRSIRTTAGRRVEGAGVSWWWRRTERDPVLLAPLAHHGTVSSAQDRNGSCVGSAAPDAESLCLTWPDPAERPSGGPS